MWRIKKQSRLHIWGALIALTLALFTPADSSVENVDYRLQAAPSAPGQFAETVIRDVWASNTEFGPAVTLFNPGDEIWGVVLYEHPGGPVRDDFAMLKAGTTDTVGPIVNIGAGNLPPGLYVSSEMIGVVPDIAQAHELEMANRHRASDALVFSRGGVFVAEP